MRITYANVKQACAKVLNLTANDARVLDYVNRATQRLLYEGKFVDTTCRFTICTSEKCLVWPREIESIESIHVCGTPVVIRGPWYEALENGPGLASECGPCLTLIDRGSTVTFDWITTTGYKLVVYSDGAESAGTVLIRYYSDTGNKVFTTYLGSVIEGERIAINTAGGYSADSTYEVLPYGVFHVEKPTTKRNLRLYARKISDGSLKPLAVYAPDELVPVYRHSYLTTLDGGSCDATQVTIIGKLRFIPAINDDSVMMISHTEAIRLGCQAVYAEECKLYDEARLLWYGRPNPVTGKMEGGAIPLLNTQLEHYRGSGQVDPIRMVGSDTWGGGSICNIV